MKKFPSKILLFGEHIINKGAHGLAIPYNEMYCQLSFDTTQLNYYTHSNEVLTKLSEYIVNHREINTYYNTLNLKEDVNKGLGFCMNIPIGYGLGSSGAVTAAIFSKYKVKKLNDLAELKNVLAITESFFHGKSSGLDPIVSYLNKTIVIEKTPNVVHQKINWKEHFSIYLLDTKTPRKTGPLVEQFLHKYNSNSSFQKVVDNEIIPLNNSIIADFINNKYDTVKIKQLSQLQLENYNELILPQYKDLWQKGLDNDTYYLKICGAGGGGYFLVFSENKSLNLSDIRPINLQ
ncbi:MAG: hypothetical protein H6578_11825 [Chitinophagales bacterium]|nr:hypothetical protein [Chitinophagales bacterium]